MWITNHPIKSASAQERAGGIEAPDITLVTPLQLQRCRPQRLEGHRDGPHGATVRMKPEYPLPPLGESALRRDLRKKASGLGTEKKADVKVGKEKKERNKEPDVRA